MSYDSITYDGITIESVSEEENLEEHKESVDAAKTLIDEMNDSEDIKQKEVKKIEEIWTHMYGGAITVKTAGQLRFYKLESDWNVTDAEVYDGRLDVRINRN